MEMKSNRKSIRLTDKCCAFIDGYRGDSFNDKLENMVMDYSEREAVIKKEWSRLDEAVKDKHQELMRLQERLRCVRIVDVRFSALVDALEPLLKMG